MKINQSYNIDWRSINQFLQEFDELSEWLIENEMEFAGIKVRELIKDTNWGERSANLEQLRPMLNFAYQHLEMNFSLEWLVKKYIHWVMGVTKGKSLRFIQHIQYRIQKSGGVIIHTDDLPDTMVIIDGEETELALRYRDLMCDTFGFSKDKVLVNIW
jgi:hypothetical protein